MLSKNTNFTIIILLVLITSIFFYHCSGDKSSDNESVIEELIDQDIKKEESESKDYKKKAKFIFYNMYSPIEMSRLFERAGINYNSSLLNPVENADDYATNVEKALNLGVYGVDLSYIRLFDQPQKSIEYLNTIQNLAGRLGIPKNVVDLATSEVDHYIEDRDSLYRIPEKK